MNPNRYTPPQVIERLTAWGGLNPYGAPAWRIIQAECHLVQRSGSWTEFEDTECARPTGTDWQMETKQIAPDAIRVGTFWVPLYPCEGWILERWFPPSAFGSRNDWYGAKSQDGETPMMGPFPDRGDWWMLDGPWDEIPPLELVRVPISIWENDPNNLRGVVNEEKMFEAMRIAADEAQEQEQRKYNKVLEWANPASEQYLREIKNNPQLTAMRNRIARQHGYQSQI